ncbi:MAG: A/G-specific adenine glycosylase [Pseudomonadales bacterium]|jgi:A/G-specific adenine glycosylase|nr:A/G-specific adenine glycosylase [Pseudomonadales bacterium]
MNHSSLNRALLDWFDQYGRKHLPWQEQRTPYRVWVSEIMLQQTQVATVIPYYERFMARFPTVAELARADEDSVLHLWTGLGYYARARNLHATAKRVQQEYGGHFPASVDALSALPGIGLSTAGAIMALGHGEFAVILDGNVKRVLTRLHCLEGWPDQPKVQAQLWRLAEALTPRERCADYTQAIMDLGATLCSRGKPACGLCPLKDSCEAYQQGRTAEFPQRKPSKTLPVKRTYMLLLHDYARGRVLLEKRPPQGIWGGLWSFPESEDISGFNIERHGQLLIDLRAVQPWHTLRHTFSHFHLDITPVQIPLDAHLVSINEGERFHWYDLKTPSTLGLAAPVKKLLQKLAQL